MRRVRSTLALSILVLAGLLGASGSARAQSARFRGLWEGTYHGGLGDQAMALRVLPRGDSSFAGALYQEGRSLGAVQTSRVAGDSLTFSLPGLEVAARATGDRLSMDLTIRHGKTHHLEMTRTTTDSTRLPKLRPEAGAAAHPVARETPPDSVYLAHAAFTRGPSSLDPCLRQGTLLLVGGGPSQPDIERRFAELAGGPKARVVIIPTASIASADPGALRRFDRAPGTGVDPAHVTVLHTTSRREADTGAFVAPLREATGVWITGGDASWLMDSYLGTRTERELIGVLKRGGVVGGTSAGAVIWAATMMTFRVDSTARAWQVMSADHLVLGDPRETGIGLLRHATLAPHFDSFHLEPALRRMIDADPGLLGIGVDEAAAFEVHDGVGRVVGPGTVRIFAGTTSRPPVVLKEGERYDLVGRVKK